MQRWIWLTMSSGSDLYRRTELCGVTDFPAECDSPQIRHDVMNGQTTQYCRFPRHSDCSVAVFNHSSLLKLTKKNTRHSRQRWTGKISSSWMDVVVHSVFKELKKQDHRKSMNQETIKYYKYFNDPQRQTKKPTITHLHGSDHSALNPLLLS